jgi:hypothetical protein
LNPHVHAIVTSGMFLPDGAFCGLPPPDQHQLLLLFRHKLLKQLLKRDKITEAAVEILDRFRHPGFSAYQGQPIEPHDTAGREKLAAYVLHPPVALQRIDYRPGTGMTFHADKTPFTNETHSVRLDPLESLAALTDHIPDQGRHLVRTYGWYSNKKRGMRRKRLPSAAETGGGQVADAPERCSVPDGSSDDDFRKECRRTWARMIKKI